MDLLNRRSSLVTAAVLTAAVTASCASSDGDDPAAEPTPVGSPSATALAVLEPVRPDEALVGDAGGTGPAGRTVRGSAGDLVHLYASCVGPGPVTATLELQVPAELSVPCDGVVSRVQVYTEQPE